MTTRVLGKYLDTRDQDCFSYLSTVFTEVLMILIYMLKPLTEHAALIITEPFFQLEK